MTTALFAAAMSPWLAGCTRDDDATAAPSTGEIEEDTAGEGATDSGAQELTIEGQVSGYDGDVQELSAHHPPYEFPAPSQQGTLEPDGSFQITLQVGDVLDHDDLEPAGDEFGTYRRFPCAADGVDPEARFTDVLRFQYHDEATDELYAIAYTDQREGAIDVGPAPGSLETMIYWVYSTHDVEIEESCDAGSKTDVALRKGWNQVISRPTEEGGRTLTQGDPPSEVAWYTDWGA